MLSPWPSYNSQEKTMSKCINAADCQCRVCEFRRSRGVKVCPVADATASLSNRAFDRAALAAREGGDPEVAEREFYAERAYLRSQGVYD